MDEEKQRAAFESAENFKKAGNLPEAARVYQQLAKENPTSVDAEIELAIIDRKLGKPDDAVKVIKDAKKRQPDNQKVISQLGYSLIDAGHFEEAVGVFDELIKLDPGNALAYSGKAVAFDKSGNHLAAQELYERALKIAPGALGIENNLAMSFILNNQPDRAVPILERLNQSHPENNTVRHNLALAYGLLRDLKKAYDLNRRDMTADQANENNKFYDYYTHLREELQIAPPDSNKSIGFDETLSQKKEPIPTAPPLNTPVAAQPKTEVTQWELDGGVAPVNPTPPANANLNPPVIQNPAISQNAPVSQNLAAPKPLIQPLITSPQPPSPPPNSLPDTAKIKQLPTYDGVITTLPNN